MFKSKRLYTAVLALLAAVAAARAQAGAVTIQEAVEQALRNYPAIRAGRSDLTASESGIDLAKTAYLPHADLYYQVNRATRNNIFGLMFPNPVIAPISGPASEDQTGASTFGSAAAACRKRSTELSNAW